MEDASPEEMKAEMDGWAAYSQEAVEAGAFVSGEGLQPSATASTVTIPENGGERSVTDGPFAETKELIDGFALVEATSREHAIALATEFMALAGDGTGEILQVFDQGEGQPT